MSSYGAWEEREPGSRRKKFAGYLKAANELRQNYQQDYRQKWNARQNEDARDLPGSYPGASVSRSGNEQLVLFPSYARRHEKRRPSAVPGTIQQQPYYGRDVRDTGGIGDTEFWRKETEDYEQDNAIVDVDVRGWIFSPHRGPLSYKSKLMMSAARSLVGIPAPSNSPSGSAASTRPSSPHSMKDRNDSVTSRHQEELALREAEQIVRRGEAEAEAASEGQFTEQPDQDTPPEDFQRNFARQRRNQVWSDEGDRRGSVGVTPSRMSQTELALANANFLERTAPFMANPMVGKEVSAFFYNDDNSTMRNELTDAAGQFSFRASLDFVPTRVRILASDKLSKTEDIRVVEPHGVSVISDIDDTIKHTAMLKGGKEVFRNVFVRDVGELSIEGVRDWYRQMAQLGCEFHYVSNSPWQLYPVLDKFFGSAGLPPGSFHLKAYSGMLQGIFEPVAERKKVAIDQLMNDFPEKRFILVGDSGEADLEVYTKTVREYPGRVLGVFIRDVTTSKMHNFFDAVAGKAASSAAPPPRPKAKPHNMSSQPAVPQYRQQQEDNDMREAIARSLADVGRPPDALERSLSRHAKSSGDTSPARPPLPPRRPTAPAAPEENLIDLSSDYEDDAKQENQDSLPQDWLRPPPRPSKPRSLSANRIETSPSRASVKENIDPDATKKTPPPRPRKPSTSVRVNTDATTSSQAPPVPYHSKPTEPTIAESPAPTEPSKPPRPQPPPPRQTYRAAARQKLTDTYHRMPSPRDMVFGSRPGTPKSSPSHSRSSSFVEPEGRGRHSREPSLADLMDEERRPPLPPSRKTTGTTSTFEGMGLEDDQHMAYGSDHGYRYGSTTSSNGAYNPQQPVLSKREETWKRRWREAKREIEGRGVVLRSWRVGEDAKQDALELIGHAMNEEERGRQKNGR